MICSEFHIPDQLYSSKRKLQPATVNRRYGQVRLWLNDIGGLGNFKIPESLDQKGLAAWASNAI